MKFPGGFNMEGMMKQAQQMQQKMQKEMEELRVEASAGGGVVTVQMKGNHEIETLKIDPEAVKDGDVEMLQDMIVAAFNEANRKVDEAMKGKMMPRPWAGESHAHCYAGVRRTSHQTH
jgi:DNA-binding YbaB/EbfC family protein